MNKSLSEIKTDRQVIEDLHVIIRRSIMAVVLTLCITYNFTAQYLGHGPMTFLIITKALIFLLLALFLAESIQMPERRPCYLVAKKLRMWWNARQTSSKAD